MKFNEVLEQVRQINLNTKTYKSVSKLPKEKGSNANILFHNGKELNRILNQCREKYETCNANILFHNGKELNRILNQCREKYETCNVFDIGVVALINRK